MYIYIWSLVSEMSVLTWHGRGRLLPALELVLEIDLPSLGDGVQGVPKRWRLPPPRANCSGVCQLITHQLWQAAPRAEAGSEDRRRRGEGRSVHSTPYTLNPKP